MAKKNFDITSRIAENNDIIHNILGPKESVKEEVKEEKKASKTYKTSLCLDKEDMEKIKVLAFKQDTSISGAVIKIVKEYIASYEKENGVLSR